MYSKGKKYPVVDIEKMRKECKKNANQQTNEQKIWEALILFEEPVVCNMVRKNITVRLPDDKNRKLCEINKNRTHILFQRKYIKPNKKDKIKIKSEKWPSTPQSYGIDVTLDMDVVDLLKLIKNEYKKLKKHERVVSNK